MTRTAALALAVFLAWGVELLPARVHAETRFALILGHNIGDIDEPALRWAESDANRFGDVLIEIGNVTEERTRVLLQPSLSTYRDAWLEMKGRLLEAKQRGERTTLFFYFSGHGDGGSLHFGKEHLDIASLQKELKAIPASTVIAIVDACRSVRVRGKTKGAVRTPAFAWPLESGATPEGFIYLTSAAKGEVAQESDDLQGSLFTHYLLSGMRGSADTDADGIVTLGELYGYGYNHTLEDTHRQTTAVQHSELDMSLSGHGTLIVTYPR